MCLLSAQICLVSHVYRINSIKCKIERWYLSHHYFIKELKSASHLFFRILEPLSLGCNFMKFAEFIIDPFYDIIRCSDHPLSIVFGIFKINLIDSKFDGLFFMKSEMSKELEF